MDQFLYKIWFKLWFESLDNALSIIRQTSYEASNPSLHPTPSAYFRAALWFLAAAFMTPLGALTYIIWFIVFRKLLRFENFQKSFLTMTSDIRQAVKKSTNNRLMEILSINVCLLPDSLSKENNLGYTEDRIDAIGNLLNQSEPNTFCMRRFVLQQWDQKTPVAKAVCNDEDSCFGMTVKVIDSFLETTDPAFVCIQEVWSIDTALKLNKLLHKKYSFIVFDAGTKTFALNKYVGFESGLLIASKYPVLDAGFKQFTRKSGLCTYTSKGLLTVKVLLGREGNKAIVGFISNSHLQSYQDQDDSIHSNQLREIQMWTKEFKRRRFDNRTEVVGFDIICGDFNIDNMSPVDKRSFEHGIWNEYKDPLMLEPGVDHSKAIGTEMRFFSIYHPLASCPKLFRYALEHERLKRIFLLDSNVEKAYPGFCKINAELDMDGLPAYVDKAGGNRRVDRIIFNKSHLLNLVEYNFISNFTRLTDHIPVLLKFKTDL